MKRQFEIHCQAGLFQLSSQIVTLNFSSHSSDFNLGACVYAPPLSYLNSCFCHICGDGGVTSGRDDPRETEDDVVCDLGCDNQERKIGKKKKKNYKKNKNTISDNNNKKLFLCCSVLRPPPFLSSCMFPAAAAAAAAAMAANPIRT